MLSITRRPGEWIALILPSGERIEIRVDDIGRGRAKLIIDAPREIAIVRGELEETRDIEIATGKRCACCDEDLLIRDIAHKCNIAAALGKKALVCVDCWGRE